MSPKEVKIMCLLWGILFFVALLLSIFGPDPFKQWLKDFGELFCALILGAITTVYVLLTRSQVRATERLLRHQFGGIPRLRLSVVERPQPPLYKIPKGYEFANNYVNRALPNRSESPDDLVLVAKYEVLEIANLGASRIEKMELQLKLDIEGDVTSVFRVLVDPPLEKNEVREIGVFPFDLMPRYKLQLTGTYNDVTGSFPLDEISVQR